MSSHQNPFDPPQPLDSNPYEEPRDSVSSSDPFSDPFSHPNDSSVSLDSQNTERGLGQSQSFPYGQSATSVGKNGDDVKAPRKQAQGQREEDLRAREEAVANRERALRGQQPNNWPPFFPFVHHDISDLPTQHQLVTKLLYYQWLALAVTLIINLLGAIFLLVAGSSEGGADVAAAAGYVPIIGAASFIAWYRPIYLGFSRIEGKAMAFFFYLYFLFAGFHLLFSIYMIIGIPSTGSAGLINTISVFSRGHILAGVFGVLASIGWVLQAAGGGLLYKRVWDYKNGNGDINFQEATNQFKSSSIRTIVMHQSRM